MPLLRRKKPTLIPPNWSGIKRKQQQEVTESLNSVTEFSCIITASNNLPTVLRSGLSEDKYSRYIKSRHTFVPRCLGNILAKFHENLPILHSLLIHLKRWYSRKKPVASHPCLKSCKHVKPLLGFMSTECDASQWNYGTPSLNSERNDFRGNSKPIIVTFSLLIRETSSPLVRNGENQENKKALQKYGVRVYTIPYT